MTAETQPQSPSETAAPVREEADGRPVLKHITFRFAALILLIVAANTWVILQFDVNVTKLVAIQFALALAAGLRKKLHKADDQVVDRFLRRALYALLGVPFLVCAWTAFLVLTSFFSAARVSGPGARDACVVAGDEECREPLFTGSERATWLLFTTPGGRHYEARLPSKRPATFAHTPWRRSDLEAGDFASFPSALIRIEYPHLDIEGGRIEVRDAITKEVLLAADTSAESASLLLGPRPASTDALFEKWTQELTAAGVTDATARAARVEAWRKFKHLADPRLPPDRRLEAVFRNDGQLDGGAIVAARSEPFTLGDAGLQDIVMERVPR